MKKIWLLCLALVLALGAMGTGLAYWTEVLEITGTVAMGELDAEFSAKNCYDNEMGPDVAQLACTLSDGGDTEPGSSPMDMSMCTATITNAYPGYVATCELTIKNNGTIPAKVAAVTYTGEVAGECVFSTKLTTVADDVIAVGGTVADKLEISIPTTAGNEVENQSYTLGVQIDFEQTNAP
jgi:predicted ribosomally synthesized peptide with SipW-like signal peptide